MSSVADVTVCSVQFWLSQLTDIPVLLLSGMPMPESLGWAAHKVVESQVALVDCDEGEPPPPQLANSVASMSKALFQKGDRMQSSEGCELVAKGLTRASSVVRHCPPFAKSTRWASPRVRS